VIVESTGANERVLEPSIGGGAPVTWSPDGARLLAFQAPDWTPVILDPLGDAKPIEIRASSNWMTGSWQRQAP
jgi:hypothetical protein